MDKNKQSVNVFVVHRIQTQYIKIELNVLKKLSRYSKPTIMFVKDVMKLNISSYLYIMNRGNQIESREQN